MIGSCSGRVFKAQYDVKTANRVKSAGGFLFIKVLARASILILFNDTNKTGQFELL